MRYISMVIIIIFIVIILQSVATQTVCQGGNASITTTFKMPSASAQGIPPENVAVMHLDQTIIQGTELKVWVISLLYHGDLLTFQASKSNLSQEDEFFTQFAVTVSHNVWETSPSKWFLVVDSCQSNSEPTTHPDGDNSTEISVGKLGTDRFH